MQSLPSSGRISVQSPGALDRPTEQLPVELREDLWVGAVQNQAEKPRDSHTETLPVGFATRQEQDVGLF